MTTYSLLYLDPPWKTEYWGGEEADQRRAPPYPTMTDDALWEFPLGRLAATDCIAFLWVLDHKLKFMFELVEHWGFSFNTVGFYWLKRTAFGTAWAYGTGYTTRAGSVEQCWLLKKGAGLPRIDASVRRLYDDMLFFPESITHPVAKHSRKPDTIRDRIVALYGDDVPRAEIFATDEHEGWAAWGNEIVSSNPGISAVLGDPRQINRVR